MMKYKKTIRNGSAAILVCSAFLLAGSMATAQESKEAKAKPEETKTATVEKNGRDPFRKFQPIIKTKSVPTVLAPPSIQERIAHYRTVRAAAANAHVAPPKPTTALLLSEMQVTGIFHTPRGWAAMVEATPLNKLSYVIYPGETFFDGQLVAIEENRLIFRREIVWTSGKREKTVEMKSLREAKPIESMTATPTAAAAPVVEKPVAQEK
jgi:hypothetical protein